MGSIETTGGIDLEPCASEFSELVESSSPQKDPSSKMNAQFALTRFIYIRAPWAVPLITPIYRKMTSNPTNKPTKKRGPLMPNEILNLQPGEWVEVLSEDEIMATLDEGGKYRGLRFMPEQKEFCGKRFKVYKQVKRMLMESNGEMRQMKIPTVYLEGAYCDGKLHGGCDRSCLLLWREVWLKRAPPPTP